MHDPGAADDLRLRFRPRGAGRFLSVGFLTIWLCGWAVWKGFALTDLGTPEERRAAADTLRAALGLPGDDAHAGLAALPADWQEITDPLGQKLLVPNLRTRRHQALVVSIIAGIAWLFMVLLAWESQRSPTLWVVTLSVAVLAAGLWRQAGWLRRGRNEWRIERGILVRQRRVGAAVTELAEARALELDESTDAVGDRWYELRAAEVGPPACALRPRARKLPQHIQIQRTIHDATTPRSLGLWLAQRAAIPFRDRVPTAASRQAEFASVREQLAGTGRLGRLD